MTSAAEEFSDLVASTRVPLLSYALRRVARSEDAADVVAEMYVVAWRRLADIPAGDRARAWLFGVARRVLANQRRGDLRRLALADRLRTELGRDAALVQPPEDTPVARALARLSADDQEVLTLTAWDGLGGEDLAVALGVTPAAARVRLHRARRRLAAVLETLDTAPAKEDR